MDMKTFLESTDTEERERVASLAGTTVAYFWQIAGGHRLPSVGLAKKLEIASDKKMLAVKLLKLD